MISNVLLTLLSLTALLFAPTSAHTWNEQHQVIVDGTFTGDMGYPRGYVARTDPTFNGFSMLWLLPSLESGRTRINGSDLVCMPSQQTSNYTNPAYPKLQVNPGGYVAMKYEENGHVTQPGNQKGKPQSRGSVYVFGTTQPSATETIVDVMAWTADSKGGNGKGFLMTAQNFDDGRCHQVNMAAPIAAQRIQDFPDRPDGQTTGPGAEQWCETDLPVPSDLPVGSTLTVYWIWQWPTLPGFDPNYPDGKDEYYTTCSDFDIVAGPISGNATHTLNQQDPQPTAALDWQNRKALTPTPSVITTTATGSVAANVDSSAVNTSPLYTASNLLPAVTSAPSESTPAAGTSAASGPSPSTPSAASTSSPPSISSAQAQPIANGVGQAAVSPAGPSSSNQSETIVTEYVTVFADSATLALTSVPTSAPAAASPSYSTTQSSLSSAAAASGSAAPSAPSVIPISAASSMAAALSSATPPSAPTVGARGVAYNVVVDSQGAISEHAARHRRHARSFNQHA